MPKVKTNRSAAKRFTRTKSGRVKRKMAFARHLLTHKSQKRKRRLRKAVILTSQEMSRIQRLLPNG